jgi:DNA-binding IclR family transcriptional regulator
MANLTRKVHMSTVERPATDKQPRNEVMSSTIRALGVLELLASEPFEWGLMEISQAQSLSKATTHRILATLIEAGFVSHDPRHRRYVVSGKALEVGTGFLRHSSAYRAAFPVMHELVQHVEGMVHFGVWDNDTLLFLRSYGQPSRYYQYADAGDRRPIYAYAMGKVMLAYAPKSDVIRIMSAHLERFTLHTITAAQAMERELVSIRKKGFAINDEESSIGLRAAAAAIFNQHNQVVASISISGPTQKLPYAKLDHCGALLRDAATKISAQLGYRPKHFTPPLLQLSTRQRSRSS